MTHISLTAGPTDSAQNFFFLLLRTGAQPTADCFCSSPVPDNKENNMKKTSILLLALVLVLSLLPPMTATAQVDEKNELYESMGFLQLYPALSDWKPEEKMTIKAEEPDDLFIFRAVEIRTPTIEGVPTAVAKIISGVYGNCDAYIGMYVPLGYINNDGKVEYFTWIKKHTLKKTFDMSKVKWDFDSDNPPVYDNTTKSVKLLNLPAGLTPTYEGHMSVTPGQKEARVTFSYNKDEYYKVKFPPLKWWIAGPLATPISFTPVSGGTRLSWKMPAHATGVEITRELTGDAHPVVVYKGTDTSFIPESGMVFGKSYEFRMRSYVTWEYIVFKPITEYGEFGPRHRLTLLVKPAGLKAERTGDSMGFDVSWRPVTDAHGYILMRQAQMPDYLSDPVDIYDGNQTKGTDKSVPKEARFVYYMVYPYIIQNGEKCIGPSSDKLYVDGSTSVRKPGDANRDGKVDIDDAVTLIDYLVNGVICPSMLNADADESGDNPNLADLIWIVKHVESQPK